MDRRELIRALGATAACAGLSPHQLAALLDPDVPRAPARAFFTAEEREAVTAVADAILPATDTPGAVEVGVVDFLETIVAEWLAPDDRARFMRGLAHLDAHAIALAGVRFPHLEEEARQAILTGLEAEGWALLEADPDAETPFFQRVRALVLHGYYTSRVGMTEELMYRPTPGRFEGCVDVSEVTRAGPGGS